MFTPIKQLKTDKLYAPAVITFAVLLRIILTAEGWPQTNSDESTTGLMSLHIANQGERPIFFYGQNYMGAFEAYLGAALFRLFGSSIFTLRLNTVLLFALFLVSMYLLTRLLYTKKLALIVLILLSLGSIVILDTELIALGGYPELLLFGSLALLLASWLAITSNQHFSWRGWCLRMLGYLGWGLVVGLGLWSDFLIIPFVLVSCLLLVLFCWRDLLKGAVLGLLLGLVIGAFPLIAYNLKAPPGQDTLSVLGFLHRSGSVELAQNHDYDQLPLVREMQGTMLIALPSATGGPTFCADAKLRLAGSPSLGAFPCSLNHTSRSLIIGALGWSLGLIVLWLAAVVQAIRSLWKLRHRSPAAARSPEKRQAILRHFAHLALLVSAALTLGLFISSPVSAVWPTNARYLIGLLVALPALIWPLWRGIDAIKSPRIGTTSKLGLMPTRSSLPGGRVTNNMDDAVPDERSIVVAPLVGARLNLGARPDSGTGINRKLHFSRSTLMLALRLGILLLIGIIFLVGTVSAFLEIPAAQATQRQQNALISDLLRIKVTHIYSEYWTCDRLSFESQERIICGSLDDNLQPTHNRYPPYYATVQADPHSAYVFPLGSVQANAAAKKVAHSKVPYQCYVFDGYVVYQPIT